MSGKIRKRLCALVLAGAVLSPASAVADEKVSFILEFPYPNAVHAGLRLAQVKGWYKDAGLDVDIEMGKGSTVTIQRIAAGQGDIGVAQLQVMAASVANGLAITSVMGMVQLGDNAITMGEDTGFKTYADFKGKKIGVAPTGAGNALLGTFLGKIGLTRDDVQLTYVDNTGTLAAYTSKSVDGIVNGAPYVLPRVADKRPGIAVYYSDVGVNLPGYGLIARTETIKSRPDVLRKMVAINQRAWAYIMDGHEQEGVDAIMTTGAQYRPDPVPLLPELKLLLARFHTPNTKGKPIGWQSEQDWKDSLALMQSVDLVKAGWNAANFFDNSFIPEK